MMDKIKLITGNNSFKKTKLTFNDVVGQKAALDKLKFFADTQTSKFPIPTFLFTGSHGLGKTYVAQKFAEGMKRRFVEVNCDMIETSKDLIEDILINQVIGDDPCTIFFDEAHRLSPEITTILLSLLDPSNNDMINTVLYQNWGIVFDMSQINVIFATTDSHKMFNPLVNRCERIYFESYEQKDLIDMLSLYCTKCSFRCNKKELADACRGRGRDAFSLAQKIKRFLERKSARVLTKEKWEGLKQIFEIYPLGLNRQEVELLKIVKEHSTISASNIALAMMVNVETIESELEVRLRELGLIQSTSRGRSLTDKGIAYFK